MPVPIQDVRNFLNNLDDSRERRTLPDASIETPIIKQTIPPEIRRQLGLPLGEEDASSTPSPTVGSRSDPPVSSSPPSPPFPSAIPSPSATPAPMSVVRQELGLPEGGELTGNFVTDFTRGVASGTQHTITSLLGARAVYNALQGDTEEAQELMKRVKEREYEGVRKYPRAAPKFTEIEDVPDFIRYASATLGETVPAITGVIASAVAGRTVAPMAGGTGIAAIMSRLVGKKAISKKAANQMAKKLGGTAGAYLGYSTIEGGSTATEQITELDELHPGVATTAGLVKGALGVGVATAVASRYGLTNDLSGGLINKAIEQVSKRVPNWVAAVAGYGAAEGVTEAMEEAVDVAAREFVDENYDALGPEARERLLEAGAAGTIVGMIVGPLFGGIGRRESSNLPETPGSSVSSAQPPVLSHPLALPAPSTAPSQLTLPSPEAHSTTYVDSTGNAAGHLIDLLPSYVDSQGNVTYDLPEVRESNENFESEGINSTGHTLTIEEEPLEETNETQQAIEQSQQARTSEPATFAPPTMRELMQMRYQTALSRTLRGTVPSKKLTVPTTRGVRAFGDTETLKSKQVKKIINFYEDVVEELGLDNNITVVMQEEPTSDSEGFNLHYNKKEDSPHLDIIGLNPKLPLGQLQTNAIHELGHLIKFTYFKDAPQEIKDELYAEFNKQVAAAEVNPQGFLQNTVGLGVASRLAEAYSSIDELSESIHGKEAAYFLHFDEWMAEQMVRAQAVGRTRLSATSQWFNELAGLLRKMFHIAKKYLPVDATISKRRDPVTGQMIAPFEQFSASKPFEQYLKYIKSKRETENDGTGGPSLTDLLENAFQDPDAAGMSQLSLGLQRANTRRKNRLGYRQVMVAAATEQPAPFIDSAELGQLYDEPDVKIYGKPEIIHQPTAIRIIRYYEQMIRDLKLNLHLTVFMHDEIPGNRLGYAYSGTKTELGALVDHAAIVMEMKSMRHFISATPVHEFGHVIHRLVYESAPDSIKIPLYKTYLKSRLKAEGDLSHYLQIHAGAQRGNMFVETYKDRLEDIYDFRLSINPDYWLGFSEWMAEQMVKAEMFSATESKAANEWLVGLKELLQHLYTRTAVSLNQQHYPSVRTREEQEAVPDFMRFLEYAQVSHRDRINGTITAEHMKRAREEDMQVGRDANRKILARQGILPPEKTANSESAPPQYSGNAEIAGMYKRAGVPKKTVEELQANADRMNWAMDVGLNLQQNTWENPGIRPLQDYNDLEDLRYTAQMKWVTRANDTVRKWVSLGRKQGEALTDFLVALDNMEYLGLFNIEPRLPTEQELAALAQKYKMSPKALEVYKIIQEDFLAVLNHIEEVSLTDNQRTIRDPQKLQAANLKIQEEFEQLRNRPYFPHARFGKYAVVSRDNKTGLAVYVEHFESHRAAKSALKGISDNHSEATTIIREVPKTVQNFQGLPSLMLEKIRDKLDPTLAEEQKAWLDDYINELALSTGMRKKLAKRLNIPGYSLDAVRTYASYFTMNALHFSRIEYGPQLEEAISRMETENASMTHLSDATKRDKILHFMADHYNYIMNPKADWEMLRSYAFFHWIAFHIKSAVLNTTQVPWVTLPYLSSRYTDIKAITALSRGYKNILAMYKGDTDKLSDTYLRALDRATQEGVVTEAQSSELAGMSQGGAISSLLPGNKVHRFVLEFNKYGAYVFQAMEQMNRRVTFHAAWELALEQNNTQYIDELVDSHRFSYAKMLEEGLSETEARSYLAAKDAVRVTQYQYAKHTRPKFMRGKAGILFTFFQFTQQTLYFATRQPGKERFWLMTLAMGGLLGMPGAEDLLAISKKLANMLAKRGIIPYFNPELEARKFIIEMSDGTIPPDLVLLGTSRYGFGIPAAMDAIGIPMANFDMSGSMSMGQIVPGLQAMMNPSGFGFDENLSRAVTDISGAALGPGFNLLKAVGDEKLPPDDFKRWERAAQRAAANVMKSSRWATEGRERSRTGATVAEFDLSDPYHRSEILMQALGFPPTRVAQRWDREMAVREVEAYWQGRKQLIFDRFDQSFVLNDTDMRSRARKDMLEFNNQVPYAPMKFNIKSLIQSRKARVRERRMFEAGYGVGKAAIPLAQDVGRLYPEVENFDRVR